MPKDYERQVKDLLPDKKFTLMVVVLKKFYEFLKLTANVWCFFNLYIKEYLILLLWITY